MYVAKEVVETEYPYDTFSLLLGILRLSHWYSLEWIFAYYLSPEQTCSRQHVAEIAVFPRAQHNGVSFSSFFSMDVRRQRVDGTKRVLISLGEWRQTPSSLVFPIYGRHMDD